jgi:signal transduction histidine kinase
MTSLRTRVLVGAALWSLGLLLVASAMLAGVLDDGRRAAAFVHAMLGHTLVVGVLAVALLAFGAWQVRAGLASVAALRARLAAVHTGETPRLAGAFATEVQPLVDDLNALLADREQQVTRARAQAGDLAHGLKTPLAVLVQEAERLAADGHKDLAATMKAQLDRMGRHVDYHLAHARASATRARLSGARTEVGPALAALAATLERLHADRRLDIEVHAPPALAVRCQREDLDEMLGNLMDNACTWARTRVRVTAASTGATVTLLVEDDGPGLDEAERATVLRRGVRLDEAVPGSGLGLAIVVELAEVYGGTLTLDRSGLGGLAARLTLPRG